MSAVPSPILQDVEASAGEGAPKLATKAAAYFVVVALATALAVVPLLSRLSPHTPGWTTFVILGLIAAVAQLFVVRTPRNQSYHTTIVFLIPAAMLLPPELVAFMGLIQHIPEWLKNRSAWYIQIFNICNWTLSMLAAYASFHGILEPRLGHRRRLRHRWTGGCRRDRGGQPRADGPDAPPRARTLDPRVGPVLVPEPLHRPRARDARRRHGRVLGRKPLADPVRSRAAPVDPPLALGAAARRRRRASTPKTGLFNARHFAVALNEELVRAERFERPLSLVMADLDLLRDINNTYGHLAGDAVLQGIAEVFRAQLRHYDVPARFGGEEFAILLPETPPEQAFEIAERIRRTVAASSFDVETSSEPIRATISIGVAGFPRDGADANELIHQADLAVYRAKLQGRNRVLDASSEPLLLPEKRQGRLVAVPEDGEHVVPLPPAVDAGPGPRAPSSTPACHARAALPLPLATARRLRGRGRCDRRHRGHLGRNLRQQHGLDRARAL